MKNNTLIDILEQLELYNSEKPEVGFFDSYALWFRIISQQSDYFKTLDFCCKKIQVPINKNERAYYHLLRGLAYHRILKWNSAYKEYVKAFKSSDNCLIDKSYIFFCMGRLFYDYDEFMEDFNLIRKDLGLKSVTTLSELPNIYSKFQEEDVYNSASLNIFSTQQLEKEPWENAIQCFDNAIEHCQVNQKEHYRFWIALSNFKKCKYKIENPTSDFNVIVGLTNNLKNYSLANYYSHGDVKNIHFNWGINYYYLAMLSKEGSEYKHEYLVKAVDEYKKALNGRESNVKDEYTYRRNESDLYYFYLLALSELSAWDIGDVNLNRQMRLYTYKLYGGIDQNCAGYYFKTLHEIFEKKIGDLVAAERCKEIYDIIDKKKYDKFPFKVGMAFGADFYAPIWMELMGNMETEKVIG